MLTNELQKQGNWLFRYRSYVPLLLLPLGIIALYLHIRYFTAFSLSGRWFELLCFLVALSGLIVRGIALGYAHSRSSGRNTREQIADQLNTSGIYSIVRHPLYLGNILIIFGILLYTQSPFFIISGVLGYILFYERIIAAEEHFLNEKFGEEYRQWANETPALLPRFSQWTKPDMSFSLRTAIKGEFYGFTALVAIMTILKHLDGFFRTDHLQLDRIWLIAAGVTLIVFFVLRFIRKHTRFFERDPL